MPFYLYGDSVHKTKEPLQKKPRRWRVLGRYNMKRKRGTFRSLAQSARERLAGNFWQDVRYARVAEVEKARQGGKTCGEVLNQFLACVKSKVVHKQEFDPAEEEIYAKVREVLCKTSSGNPLAEVLDRDYMQKLGDSERERYVFKLSEKVKACIERFEQERAFEKAVCV